MLVIVLILGGALGVTAVCVQREDHVPRSAAGIKLSLAVGQAPVLLGEMSETEIEARLTELSPQLKQPPQDPQIDSVNRGVVPGVCGWELDVQMTKELAMSSVKDSVLQPLLRAIYPTSLLDYAHYPIYQGNSHKKQIALVINVAWGNENLPEMLETLSQENVKASFFLVGRWVAQNSELVKQIAALGHEFGNHAYSDPHLPQMSKEGIAQEITRTSAAITQITGQEIRFFSPPYNDFNQTVLDTAANLGYLTVLCSLDTADWMRPGVDQIVRRIVPKAHNGAIVLMHPTEQTPAALKRIISGLKAEGYELVTVGQLLAPTP